MACIPSIGGGGGGSTSLALIFAALGLLLPGINAGHASSLKGWSTSHAASERSAFILVASSTLLCLVPCRTTQRLARDNSAAPTLV